MTAVLGRISAIARWLTGVGAATAVVLLFTLDPDPPPPTPTVAADVLYAQHCASCHGIDGSGGQGPRLAGTMTVLYPDPLDQEAVVREGSTGMPAFADVLSDRDIASVVRFTRNRLG